MRYPFSNYQLTSFLLHLLLDLGILSKPNSDDLFRHEFSQLPASSTTVLEVLFRGGLPPSLPRSQYLLPPSTYPSERLYHPPGWKEEGREENRSSFPPSVSFPPPSVRIRSLKWSGEVFQCTYDSLFAVSWMMQLPHTFPKNNMLCLGV